MTSYDSVSMEEGTACIYRDKLARIIEKIDTGLVDFSAPRKRASPPTQVSSEFLTNKEQGDWAERTLLDGINQHSKRFVAVMYGKNDNIVAGEENFTEFYEAYQEELDAVGKRPDILIFDRKDFPFSNTYDISDWGEELEEIVPKAKCGIEVRSSAFLIDKYEAFMHKRTDMVTKQALGLRQKLLQSPLRETLQSKSNDLFEIVHSLNASNLSLLTFRKPSWKSTPELRRVVSCLSELKECLSLLRKRTYLSITPKIEDLQVVYTWVRHYNVPHYYVQVFFDKAYGISFQQILTLLANPEKEGIEYSIEGDVKNQYKQTVKINAAKQNSVLQQIDLPSHKSIMKELGRGRLLFYVTFGNSASIINQEGFRQLFGFELE